MTRFIFRRIVRGLIALFLFQTILFALLHALPYDFSSISFGGPGYRDFIRNVYGLDLPLWEQYGRWLLGFLRLDLGVSYLYWPTPVAELLLTNLPRTLLLFLSSAILAGFLGIWLGKTIAWRRGGLLEAGASLGGVAAYTSFAPFLGFLLIMVFARELRWFPYQRLVDHNVWYLAPVSINWVLARMAVTGALLLAVAWGAWRATRRIRYRRGRLSLCVGALVLAATAACMFWWISGYGHLALDVSAHLALPLIAVVLLSFGETMMLMRASMLETVREDHVLLARAVGYPQHVVRDRHVARNAILPVLTRLVLGLPFVLVGSLVIERVFLWRAMGHIVFTAIEFYDVPILLGILSVVGLITLSAHVLLDLAYVYLDPRLRHPEGGQPS